MNIMSRNFPWEIIKSNQVRQITCDVTLRYVRAAIVAVDKQWILHLCVCVCVCVIVALGIQHEMFYSIFPHYLIHGMILLSIKDAFRVSLQLLSETGFILRRTEGDELKMYNGLHVKYSLFLSDFNKTWVFLTDFRKIVKYKI
jgi:hypothetical protein